MGCTGPTNARPLPPVRRVDRDARSPWSLPLPIAACDNARCGVWTRCGSLTVFLSARWTEGSKKASQPCGDRIALTGQAAGAGPILRRIDEMRWPLKSGIAGILTALPALFCVAVVESAQEVKKELVPAAQKDAGAPRMKAYSRSRTTISRKCCVWTAGDSSGWPVWRRARILPMPARPTSTSSAWRSGATCFAMRKHRQRPCSRAATRHARPRRWPISPRSSPKPIVGPMANRSKAFGRPSPNETRRRRPDRPEPCFRLAKSWRYATRTISG